MDLISMATTRLRLWRECHQDLIYCLRSVRYVSSNDLRSSYYIVAWWWNPVMSRYAYRTNILAPSDIADSTSLPIEQHRIWLVKLDADKIKHDDETSRCSAKLNFDGHQSQPRSIRTSAAHVGRHLTQVKFLGCTTMHVYIKNPFMVDDDQLWQHHIEPL